ncbi:MULTISPECIES: ABC transporter permease [unclassified Breznakia]|uniref:ABC transporter permease n=1 Tax=unclassified Breznakia TaxID=2623764 RepID=UPI00247492FF|nr:MULTISPECIES: ABC transporter permease [unclassified Breznakia]MDH6367689.1 ABC-2 type transport system permease protein [Breznakia sp. PH1-1]MDH6404777.1 ABC-2 type transport system permease protein [Breznakia sp. PF1-11]MDH6412516.1 ABC-2 type transport system permease protein [Breznakia sp. PFB1-11]MDH6414876.1 ABC-2 type transport system permease protein [Breznakia sp. PFB1-14]MDH6417187.1 ABC-2 type transport system permease protein [Breznakia sp. PFB1-4]
MKRICKITWLSFKSNYSYLDIETFLLIKIISPVMQMLFFTLLATYTGGIQRLPITVVGNAMLICTFGTFGDLGVMYIRDRYQGVLRLIVASSKHPLSIFLEKGICYVFEAVLTALFGLVVGQLLFQVQIIEYPLVEILLCIFVSMIACVALGYVLSSICLVVSDINMLLNVISMSMLFLCGANIDVAKLPTLLQYIAYALPVTRGLQAIDLLVQGAQFQMIVPLLIQEFVYTCILFLIGIILYQYFMRKAQVDATLDIM